MLLLLPAAFAETYEDDFSADLGRWSGGEVVDGALRVTGTASFAPGPIASFTATVRVRVTSGASVGIAAAAGGEAWMLDYAGDGGVRFGADAIPLPTGHYAWEPDADPVIEPGADYWDGGNTLHPEVFYDEASATWFLFWTGEMPPPGYAYRQIGLATSPDGVTWTRYAGNPVLTIDYDRTTVDGIHVHMPTVVKDGADWFMYYGCYQNDVGNRICYATSPDGYDWTPQGVALDRGAEGEIDSGSLRSADVLIGPDGTWHMVYNATDPEQHYGPTAYATSPDGVTWTKHGAISADEHRLQGGGMFDGPYGVEQWWNCADVFCHSTAQWSDLTTWEDEADVVLAKAWADWNDGYIQAPTPWLVGTVWHMWFNGYTYTENLERLGHARSVPVPGAWLDVALAWDGATLTVTQSGAAQSVPLAAADGLHLVADGVVEVDAVTFAWEEPAIDTGDTGGETGAPDTGPGDTAGDTDGDTDPADTDPADTDPADTARDTGADGADGCGCASGGDPAWLGAIGALVALGRRAGRARARL